MIRIKLQQLEHRYLEGVAHRAVDGGLVELCHLTFSEAQAALQRSVLAHDTVLFLQQLATRMRITSRELAALEEDCDRLECGAIGDCRRLLEDQGACTGLQCAMHPPSPCEPPDDATTFAPYRQWFLEHFANPYPSPKDKDLLVEQVPMHTRRQLDTWLTNQRRRSGWHALKRKYEDIGVLLRRIDEADEDDEEMNQARKEVERVKAYFRNDRQDYVRDEIREIISQGPPATATKRRIDAGPTKRVVGRSPRGRNDFVHPLPATPTSLPSPLRLPPAPQPPIYAIVPLEAPRWPATQQQLAPGRPSILSWTDAPRRSVSGSSSSSTDSLISYDSLEIPVSTPASPPVSSSLLNFDGRSTFVSPARAPRLSPRRGSFVVRNSLYPTRPHPYFCTVNELPTGSSLARFASS